MEGMGVFLCFMALCHSASTLQLTGPSVHTARLGSDARVPCLVTVDNPPVDPEHITIVWFHQDKEILSYDKSVRTTSPRYSLSTEELGAGTGDLTITNIQIPDGGMYKCSVTYRSETKEKEIRLDVGAPPQVRITGNTGVKNNESVLSCSVTGFYPIDIDIRWFRDGERLKENVIVGDFQRNPDRTYNVTSTLTITPTEEDKKRTYSCRVQQEYLPKLHQEDIDLVYKEGPSAGIIATGIIVPMAILLIAGVLWWRINQRRKASGKFIVRDIKGPPKLIDGEETTLYCTVDNYPENLCVTWLIRRAGQEEEEIQTSQMRGDSEEEKESLLDTSYVIRSQPEGRQYSTSLSFIPHIQSHRDVTFICRGVSHPHKEEKKYHCKIIYVRPKLSPPVMRRLLDSGEMKYLLSLEKFYPKSIKVIWTCGVGAIDNVLSSTDSSSNNPDRTYNVSSEVTIPEERHKDPGFRVRVTWDHEAMEEAESRELTMRDPEYTWTPVVGEIEIPPIFHDSKATMWCKISGYFPDAVTVRWIRSPDQSTKLYEEIDAVFIPKTIPKKETDNTYTCTATLTITPTLGTHQGAEYICLVDHPSLEKPIEKRTGRLQVYAKPHMLAPIEITMAASSRVQFSLTLQKFYPKDITISWKWKDSNGLESLLSPQQTFTTQDNNITYNVTSVVQIPVYQFRDPQMKIIVEWKHESMETPETRELSIRDLPWRPHVGSISVPNLEDGKEATLTCDISGYFPDLLSITWFTKKDGNLTALPIESSRKDGTYKMSHKEKRQRDNTYCCKASLTFTPIISSDRGSEIICRVEHPSLERPIERSTGPLHIVLKGKAKRGTREDVISSPEAPPDNPARTNNVPSMVPNPADRYKDPGVRLQRSVRESAKVYENKTKMANTPHFKTLSR